MFDKYPDILNIPIKRKGTDKTNIEFGCGRANCSNWYVNIDQLKNQSWMLFLINVW